MNFKSGKFIALSAALPAEVEPVLDLLTGIELITPGRFKIYTGRYRSIPVVAVQTGQGARSAEAALEYLYQKFDIERQICFGFAGAVMPGLRTGAIVVPDRVSYADRIDDAIALDPIGPIKGWEGKSLYEGLGVEVDRPYHAEDKRKIGALGAVTVDMESCTTALIAKKNNTPVTVVRAILDESDFDLETVNPQAKLKDAGAYGKARKKFMDTAAVAARKNAEFIRDILSEIMKTRTAREI